MVHDYEEDEARNEYGTCAEQWTKVVLSRDMRVLEQTISVAKRADQ